MDLLCRRYASPFEFLDRCIEAGSLTAFVESVYQFQAEEDDKKAVWEIWLHKVWDKSYSDFLKELDDSDSDPEPEPATMTTEETNAALDLSLNILANFNPTKEGDALSGSI